jgi:hypothetical protein
MTQDLGMRVKDLMGRLYFAEGCSASEEGSYLRLIDFGINQLQAQG